MKDEDLLNGNYIGKHAEEFADMVFPNAPQTQKEDVKQCFFSGAYMIIETLNELSRLKDDKYIDEFLNNLDSEIADFFTDKAKSDVH